MQVIEKSKLFTEITDEESSTVQGGDALNIGFSESQIIFALGAYEYTLLLTGNKDLANSVLVTQFNRAFTSGNVETSNHSSRRHSRRH